MKGLPNEHICASALYYYDSANVTDSHLAFRENIDTEFFMGAYEQHRYDGLVEIYGLYGHDNFSVRSTCSKK